MTMRFTKEEYQTYINSRQWKNKRAMALERAGYKCQRCGFSKWSKKLEVHHLTYDRFGNEIPEDLMVLCEDCHKAEDKIREDKSRQKSRAALYNAQLEGWANKVYGEDWRDYYDENEVEEKFWEWTQKKQSRTIIKW